MPLVWNMPGFCIYEGFEYASGLEYARVTQGSEFARICLNSSLLCLICLNMPEYAGKCVNMPQSA